MTIEEAIKAIRPVGFSIEGPTRRVGEFIEALDVSEDAMEELRQYRAIGTVEECHTAAEKKIPFRPTRDNLIAGVGRCKCGAEFIDRSTAYCGNCGQKLDWGGGKDE